MTERIDDDATLVARCRRGEAAAWTSLVQRYQRLVYAIVLRVGLDEHAAADVFQTVFTRLLKHLPDIAHPDKLQAWVVTTAKRESLLQRQRGLRQVSITRGDDEAAWDAVDEGLLPDQALSELQQHAALNDALAHIDVRCQALLKLLFRDEDDHLGYDEIAQRTGMPIGSIGPSRARCLDKLRRAWAEREGGGK